jgi:hypothetical protein
MYYRIGQDLEGSGRSWFRRSILAFAWRDEEIHGVPQTVAVVVAALRE